MLLLTRGNLAELLLGDSLHETLKTAKDLVDILDIDNILIGTTNKLLDTCQTLTIKVRTKPLIHLVEHHLIELGILILTTSVKDGIHKAAALELRGSDALAHDESLVGLGEAETLDERAGGTTLGDETQGGERGEEESVGRAVDEVCKGDDGGGEADDWTIETDD